MTTAVIEPTAVAVTPAAVRVVLADDHALVREGLTHILERGGVESARGVGYLLKEKVGTPHLLVDAVRRVATGDSVLDPDVISRLVRRERPDGPLDRLTVKEREVMALMAQGRSNAGIAAQLFVTVPAVERHVTGIFTKLGLQRAENLGHRRVLAVLAYLRGGGVLT